MVSDVPSAGSVYHGCADISQEPTVISLAVKKRESEKLASEPLTFEGSVSLKELPLQIRNIDKGMVPHDQTFMSELGDGQEKVENDSQLRPPYLPPKNMVFENNPPPSFPQRPIPSTQAQAGPSGLRTSQQPRWNGTSSCQSKCTFLTNRVIKGTQEEMMEFSRKLAEPYPMLNTKGIVRSDLNLDLPLQGTCLTENKSQGKNGQVFRVKNGGSDIIAKFVRRENFRFTEVLVPLLYYNPGLVRILGVYVDRDEMGNEFVVILQEDAGKNLHQRFKERPIREREVRKILQQILESLVQLHLHGVTLGDIKPQNVAGMMKGSELIIKLIDYGSCDSSLQKNQAQGLTLAYCPPEYLRTLVSKRWDGFTMSHKGDIYSLGITALFLLTGKHVWADFTLKHWDMNDKKQGMEAKLYMAKQPEAVLSYLPESCSKELNSLLSRMICQDLEKRISASDALREDFFKVPPVPLDITRQDREPPEELEVPPKKFKGNSGPVPCYPNQEPRPPQGYTQGVHGPKHTPGPSQKLVSFTRGKPPDGGVSQYLSLPNQHLLTGLGAYKAEDGKLYANPQLSALIKNAMAQGGTSGGSSTPVLTVSHIASQAHLSTLMQDTKAGLFQVMSVGSPAQNISSGVNRSLAGTGSAQASTSTHQTPAVDQTTAGTSSNPPVIPDLPVFLESGMPQSVGEDKDAAHSSNPLTSSLVLPVELPSSGEN